MTRTDHRIIFTALGFLAVILREDVTVNRQVARATSIARLIESFCATSLSEAFADGHLPYATSPSPIEKVVETYLSQLRTNEEASLDFDRQTLLQMYELLTLQKLRHEQKDFFASGSDDMIANRVLQLAGEQLERNE